MTDTYSTPAVSIPSTVVPPPNKPKAWWKKPLVLLPAGALVLGLAIGSAGEPKTVEVTKEVPGPERIVEKRVEVKVPITPAACLTALDINEQAFSLLSESLGHVMDGDYTAANRSTDKITPLVPRSNTAKAECRAAK